MFLYLGNFWFAIFAKILGADQITLLSISRNVHGWHMVEKKVVYYLLVSFVIGW